MDKHMYRTGTHPHTLPCTACTSSSELGRMLGATRAVSGDPRFAPQWLRDERVVGSLCNWKREKHQ